MDDRDCLTEFVSGIIWTKRVPLKSYGLPIGTRMTVVRLQNSQLWLHSPTPLDPQLEAELNRLGTVQFIIAPNRLHHLFIADYISAFPGAAVYASPALPKKRLDLAFHGVLEDEPEPDWNEEIDQVLIRGSAYLDEVAFLVRAARTLIVADLLECVTREDPWLLRLAGRLAGTYGTPALTRDQRFLIRDRDALRVSLDRIRRWDFDRIIMAHGPLVDLGGNQLFADAFRWVSAARGG